MKRRDFELAVRVALAVGMGLVIIAALAGLVWFDLITHRYS
jgi:hypothetical protein